MLILSTMVALALKTSLLVVTLGVAGVSGLGQFGAPPAPLQRVYVPVVDSGAIASALAQWRALQQTDALPFDSYAGFLMAHPGWPNEAANRRAAEKQAAAGSASAGSVIAYFRRFPAQSTAGQVAQARALLSIGSRAQADDAARQAWRRGALSPIDEAYVLQNFAGALTSADQDARMDTLLWQNATAAAQRQIALVTSSKRAVFAARLAMRARTTDAAAASSGDPAFLSDAGYIADRATWLRNTNAESSSRYWLARARTLTTRPGDVDKWYDVLTTAARGAAADGQWQLAYDIARQVDDAYPAGTDIAAQSYAERDDYTNLTWLAGQAAFKHLGRPADAMVLFDRYGKGSRSPQVRAKGAYWAGRSAEAAGKSVEALAFYTRAAELHDQFYGQLAAERTRRPLTPPPPIGLLPITPDVRQAFDRREVVQAARFLGQIGDRQDQTAFIRQIAMNATSDTDHQLAAELSRTLGRPDLGVMIGRSALVNGLSDYTAIGYPTVSVPAGYEGDWTLIHAISRQESQFDRTAVSHAGARGLMQLMPGTAREQAGKIGLTYSPDALSSDQNFSIQLGSSYFDRVFANYGSYPLAIAAYNAGGGNVNKWLAANGDPRNGSVQMVDWIEAIPFQETRNYVQRVLENAVVYDLMNPPLAKSRGTARLSWYLGKSARPG